MFGDKWKVFRRFDNTLPAHAIAKRRAYTCIHIARSFHNSPTRCHTRCYTRLPIHFGSRLDDINSSRWFGAAQFVHKNSEWRHTHSSYPIHSKKILYFYISRGFCWCNFVAIFAGVARCLQNIDSDSHHSAELVASYERVICAQHTLSLQTVDSIRELQLEWPIAVREGELWEEETTAVANVSFVMWAVSITHESRIRVYLQCVVCHVTKCLATLLLCTMDGKAHTVYETVRMWAGGVTPVHFTFTRQIYCRRFSILIWNFYCLHRIDFSFMIRVGRWTFVAVAGYRNEVWMLYFVVFYI